MADLHTVSVKMEVDTTEATEKIAALTTQVDELLGKLEQCKGLCSECKILVDIPKVALALRAQDYRAIRTE